MTVCIAAISRDAIVAASDTKLTKGYYSGDLLSIKTAQVHPKWHSYFSGKISRRHSLVRTIRSKLDRTKDYTADEIAQIFTEEYISYQRKLAYESVLSPFGLTFDVFLKKRKELGDAIFQRLWDEIGRVQVEVDILVVGFEKSNNPRIFIVSNPTTENPSFVNHCDESFGAIGTGAYLAESMLFAFPQHISLATEETVYHLAAAKFEAESASDVGTATYLRVFYPDGTIKRIDSTIVNRQFRDEWKNHGKPRMRAEAISIIKEALEKADVTHPGQDTSQRSAQKL